MVCCSTVNACSSSGHTVDNIFIRYFYIDCVVNFLSACFQGFGQCLGLRNRSWEAIQHVALCCVRFGNTVYNKITGQFIRNKKSLIHVSFCCNFLCLSSFSGSRSSQHDDLHSLILLYITLTRFVLSSFKDRIGAS